MFNWLVQHTAIDLVYIYELSFVMLKLVVFIKEQYHLKTDGQMHHSAC